MHCHSRVGIQHIGKAAEAVKTKEPQYVRRYRDRTERVVSRLRVDCRLKTWLQMTHFELLKHVKLFFKRHVFVYLKTLPKTGAPLK